MRRDSGEPQPHPIQGKAEDLLTEREYDLFQRTKDGQGEDITCPRCTTPLYGSFYFFTSETGYQHKGVRLHCRSCGFDEY